MDWHTHYPPDEQEDRGDLRLWERMDEDPPAFEAWAIFSSHEGSFDLFVHPALHGTPLHEAVADPAPPRFEQSLDELPAIHLPDGFCRTEHERSS